MRRILVFVFGSLLFYACNKKYEPRDITTINVQEFSVEGTSIRAIHAIDENTLYFAGSNGIIGFTKDGGKTFTKKTIKYQDTILPEFRSIYLNNKSLFVLSIGNPALLYKISERDTAIVYQENHKKVFYDAIQFYDDGKDGIAVGDPTEDCASIIMTRDAGNTWKKIPCDRLPKFETGEAFFAASNTNIKTLGSSVWIASGGNKARVLRSDDYGKKWKVFNTPIVQGINSEGIYSIDMYNFKRGIIIGGDYTKPDNNTGNKAITNNGGKTWQLVSNGSNPGYKSCIKYVPLTTGEEVFAVGKTGVSYSKDRGVTWRKVSDASYYSIQFVDKYIAWLSGNNKIGKLVLN